MDTIWADGRPSQAFRDDIQAWAREHDGRVQEGARSALFCIFPRTEIRSRVRLGVYEADGRNMLRLDTVREEIEVKLVERYDISDSELAVRTDKGSRAFEYDAATGAWTVNHTPV